MRQAFLAAIALAVCQASAQYGVTEIQDLVYTEASGFPQRLDLYLPTPLTNLGRPGLVFVHGGGWAAGSKADFAAFARYYAAKGFVCTSINYRLTQVQPWPAQIDDTQAAVRWMRKFAPFIGLNGNRIGAVGGSAGGHLVLMLGATETLNDFDPALTGYSSRVQAVVDFYGPSDMANRLEWRTDIWPLITALAGKPYSPFSMQYRAISPINYVTPDDAPTVIFQGDIDDIVPVAQSRRIVDRMVQRGVPVFYYEFPGQGHGFDGPTSALCLQVMDAFLPAALRP
jgi:acetyl esterase/lipase